jgi:3-oxoacyl-[acyl-carrier-protein] synthase II
MTLRPVLPVAAPVITAWEAYSPLGHGAQAHAEGLRSAGGSARSAVRDFDVRETLGRTGTRSMDRAAGLAVTTTRRLLERAGEAPLPGALLAGYGSADVGVVLGVSDPVKSVMDFLRDTWTRDKPYDVDPSHVPRTLMNFAAGQCAIWHGVRGPNATICGSHATALLTLNYARRLQRNGHAQAVIWGAVEELSDDRAAVESARTSAAAAGPGQFDAAAAGPGQFNVDGGRPPGEGCVMFLLESAQTRPAERTALAEVLAVEFGVWADAGRIRGALAGCLSRALNRAAVSRDEVFAVAPLSSAGLRGSAERAGAVDVLGSVPVLTKTADAIGDTGAVSAAFQITELLVAGGGSGRIGVATTADGEGRVGCALLRVL